MYLRSLHFIPAHRLDFLSKSRDLKADAIVLDLEDGVAGDLKRAAAENVVGFLSRHGVSPSPPPVFLRVNLPGSDLTPFELGIITSYPDIGLIFPKVHGVSDMEQRLATFNLPNAHRCIVLIEDAEGLTKSTDVACKFRPLALALGLEDFLSTSIHVRSSLTGLVTAIRSHLAISAFAAGIQCIDTVSLDLFGGTAFEVDCNNAKSCGMTGKFTLHPNQIAACNSAFSPAKEIAEESAEIALAFSGAPDCGYVKWRGSILSPPKIAKAIFINKCMRNIPK